MTDDNKLLYDICYDDERSSAVYTTHVIDLANKRMNYFIFLEFINFLAFFCIK